MHISLEEFCEIVRKLEKSNAEKALALLWFFDRKQPNVEKSSGELAKLLDDHHLGTPNSTSLGRIIGSTGLARGSRNGFSLKTGSRRIIQSWLPAGIEGMEPAMDHSIGYLPEAVWVDTRDYIERVCRQLNGSFSHAYYDAALVMLRRLLETLVIEAYEHLSRQGEIRDGAGNYMMFGALVDRATGKGAHTGLNIGRNTKNALEAVKALGDRSAHDRRFNAVAADLTKIQIDVRSGAQDLIQLASLKRASKTA